MQAVAGSLYWNTYQTTGLNTAEKHLSPLIHQVWQIQIKKYTLLLWTGIIYSLLYSVIKAFKHTGEGVGPVYTWSFHAFSLIGYLSGLLKLLHLQRAIVPMKKHQLHLSWSSWWCDSSMCSVISQARVEDSSHKPYHQSHQYEKERPPLLPIFKSIQSLFIYLLFFCSFQALCSRKSSRA